MSVGSLSITGSVGECQGGAYYVSVLIKEAGAPDRELWDSGVIELYPLWVESTVQLATLVVIDKITEMADATGDEADFIRRLGVA